MDSNDNQTEVKVSGNRSMTSLSTRYVIYCIAIVYLMNRLCFYLLCSVYSIQEVCGRLDRIENLLLKMKERPISVYKDRNLSTITTQLQLSNY